MNFDSPPAKVYVIDDGLMAAWSRSVRPEWGRIQDLAVWLWALFSESDIPHLTESS